MENLNKTEKLAQMKYLQSRIVRSEKCFQERNRYMFFRIAEFLISRHAIENIKGPQEEILSEERVKT